MLSKIVLPAVTAEPERMQEVITPELGTELVEAMFKKNQNAGLLGGFSSSAAFLPFPPSSLSLASLGHFLLPIHTWCSPFQ